METPDVLINILSTAVAVEYMDHGFDKRYSGFRRTILFASGCVAYYLMICAMNHYMEFEGVLGLGYGLVLAAYGGAALKGRMREILMLGLAWVPVTIVSAYVMFGVLGILTGEQLDAVMEMDNEMRMYSMVAAAALKFSLGRMILALNKKRAGAGWREDRIIASAFLILFALILGLFRLERGGVEQKERYYLSLGLVAGIMGLILLLGYFYRRLARYQEERMNARLRKKSQEKQEEQIKDLYRLGREVNRLRHDMNGRLNVLYRLILKERYREAARYIEEMGADLGRYPELPQDTGNEGLNAALIKGIHECREKGIRFRYVVMGRTEQIDIMDMGNLLFNLLANGVEAAVKVQGERELELTISREGERIEIYIENTTASSVLEGNPWLESRKQDKEQHGFGMESIYEIVERYQGEYGCWEEEGRFIQRIILGSRLKPQFEG